MPWLTSGSMWYGRPASTIPLFSSLIQEFDNFLPFSTHIFTACCKFFPCCMDGRLDLLIGNIKFLSKFFHQAIGDRILAGKREEWVHKINFSIYNGINVILDIFGIRSNNRAVVMVVRVWQIHCARKECLDRKCVSHLRWSAIVHVREPVLPGSIQIHLEWTQYRVHKMLLVEAGESLTENPSWLKNVNQNG